MPASTRTNSVCVCLPAQDEEREEREERGKTKSSKVSSTSSSTRVRVCVSCWWHKGVQGHPSDGGSSGPLSCIYIQPSCLCVCAPDVPRYSWRRLLPLRVRAHGRKVLTSSWVAVLFSEVCSFSGSRFLAWDASIFPFARP